MRVAVYVRVSTSRQVKLQTIEQQLERVRKHVRKKGWELPDENVFRDDGYSGTILKRPALDALRDRVRLRDLEIVVVLSPDRLARNYVHQMVLIEELEKSGCKVEFVERPMSSEPNDQLLLQIRGAVAEYERRRRDLEQRDEALAGQERQLEAQADQRMELAGVAGSVEDFCERVRSGLAEATFEQKRELVELLVDRVIVTDEEVEIRYVVPTEPSSEQVRFCHLRSDYLHHPSTR
jgi:DNA invertase Pin-like site-specific DNA recombinase